MSLSVRAVDLSQEIAAAKLREDLAQQQAAEAAAKKAEADSVVAKEREIARKAAEEQHEAELQERQRQSAIEKNRKAILSFTPGFGKAVQNFVKNSPRLTSEELLFIQHYTDWLVAQKVTPAVPFDVHPQFQRIADSLQDKFAYGMVLSHLHKRPVLPGSLNGQSTDWFEGLFRQKMDAADGNKSA